VEYKTSLKMNFNKIGKEKFEKEKKRATAGWIISSTYDIKAIYLVHLQCSCNWCSLQTCKTLYEVEFCSFKSE
jgi:hypothetical protein